MNGKLLFRRSASMVLATSFLLVAACGVEMNGLFEGDAAIDGAAPDAGRDTPSSDRVADDRADTAVDTGASDVSSTDRVSSDGPVEDRRSDGSVEPPVDGPSGSDGSLDVATDDGGGRDTVVDVVGIDALADADAGTDAGGPRDATGEDASTDPKVDATFDVAIDVAADARPDRPADTIDAGPPGTCSGACNTFDNISQTVMRTVAQGATPAMTGGTIVDGTYVVTSIVHYNGDMSAFSLAETSVIAGNMDAWISETNGQAPVRYTTTFTANNNQLAFDFCCPSGGTLTILYTTDGTTLSHVDPANPNRVITYTRQ
jgi:hypothetical protein